LETSYHHQETTGLQLPPTAFSGRERAAALFYQRHGIHGELARTQLIRAAVPRIVDNGLSAPSFMA
jgi:hypothetical protein